MSVEGAVKFLFYFLIPAFLIKIILWDHLLLGVDSRERLGLPDENLKAERLQILIVLIVYTGIVIWVAKNL